jgi:RNA polymerase sigma factor (sigma-70 family)
MDNPKSYISRAIINWIINRKKRKRREMENFEKFVSYEINNWIINKGYQSNSENPKEQDGDIGTYDTSYEKIEEEMTQKAIIDEEDELTRTIIELKYRDGLTLGEIATKVGRSPSVVHGREKAFLERAKLKLEKDKK